MKYMSDVEFEEKLKKVQERNLSIERKKAIRAEQTKYWPKFKKPSTSKIALVVASLLCIEIVLYCQHIILITGDTSALTTMLGVVSAGASVLIGYFIKSKAENSRNGITFEMAMSQLKNDGTANNNAVG